MENNYRDKKSRSSRLGKRNEENKSGAKNNSANRKEAFSKGTKFDKKSNNSFDKKDGTFKKKSGIRTAQNKEYDIEELTGTQTRKSNFKSQNNRHKNEMQQDGDHFYGKPFEKKENKFGKEKSNGKPFRKKEGSSERNGKSFEPKRRGFDESKPFEKREKSYDKPYSKENKSFEKKDRTYNKSYDKENKPFEKKERFSNKNTKLEFEDFSYGDSNSTKNKFGRNGRLSSQRPQQKEDVVKDFKERKEKAKKKNIKTPDYDLKKFKDIEQDLANKEKTKRKRINRKEQDVSFEEVKGDGGEVRLNRFIANAGVCSRREADELIQKGRVKINGQVMTEMGYRVKPTDSVYLDDEPLKRERIVYVLLNKPKDHITTTDDPEGRKTVMNLVRKACNERIYPVGRLDRNTTGLLLLTNDGALAEKLAHPSNNIKKVYQILLDKPITEDDFNKIVEGIELEDGNIKPDKLSVISDDGSALEMHIHSGKNRIVRRIFEHLGYEILRLDRVSYAGLTKKGLTRGEWRYLTEQEVIRLKYFVK
ncbi:pseudouridine synthase [Thermoflexibacter ruber]|uniref:Pseudouridine synthase n=1 Tax=Thermoflexibacter ruber TaxID=1003 RepID=A0A1I2IMS1_9BACT|nr:pseudouridine synthase [Thermoflexibacter ruber]SFF43702.1 23S rRNA pseudouridine2605 synthase [Thermoflexibacter ruber]